MNLVIGGLLLVVVLVGCSKESPQVASSAGKVAEVLAGMEAKGEIPVLDRSTTLAGVDADKNGIRDDIDKLIVAQHKSAEEAKAIQQYARAIQNGLSDNLKTRAEVQLNGNRLGKAIDCLGYKTGVDAERLHRLITDSSINTRVRKLEEDRVDQLASGMVFHSYGSKGCE